MIYINVWSHEQEAVKLLAMGRRIADGSAQRDITTYKNVYSQNEYGDMCVYIGFLHAPYPVCCALYTLASARVALSPSKPTPFAVECQTADAAINQFKSQISGASGGGTLVADRADGTGLQIPFLKKLDWSSVGMTLEPCISLNNPNYNSDVGVWLLRKHNGQVRRKLEDMK